MKTLDENNNSKEEKIDYEKIAEEKLFKAVGYIYAPQQNVEMFLQICQKSAKMGNAKAQYIMGMWYEKYGKLILGRRRYT